MDRITIDAKVENLDKVIGFVEGLLEDNGCPMGKQMSITLAVEEIFVNIANYAYADKVGEATIEVDFTEDPGVQITFMDTGIPYNPLEKADPDVTLSAEEREIGGLGIFMVKKSMDSLNYEYRDNKNIFTIKKLF